MTLSLKHAFTSALPNGGDASVVRPSDWNAEHTLTLASGKLVGRLDAGTGPAQEIDFAAGTYTPTVSNASNLDSAPTASQAQYLRLGATVTVSGRALGVNPTAAGAASFELSLPIASNIGAVEDVAGVAFCAAIAGQGAAIAGSVANDTAVMSWIAVDVTSRDWSYTFTYQVI